MSFLKIRLKNDNYQKYTGLDLKSRSTKKKSEHRKIEMWTKCLRIYKNKPMHYGKRLTETPLVDNVKIFKPVSKIVLGGENFKFKVEISHNNLYFLGSCTF